MRRRWPPSSTASRAGSAAIVQAELLEVGRLPSLVEFAVRSFGALDVLVNNASTFYPTPIGEITPQTWDDLLGTNLKVPAVSLAGRGARAAQVQRTDHQYRRYPCVAPAARLHRVLHRQGRPAHADALAGQGARARGARQRHCARSHDVARGPGRFGQAAPRSSSARFSSAWARPPTSRAPRCSLPRRRHSSPARSSRWTAAAASPGRKKGRCRQQPESCGQRRLSMGSHQLRTCTSHPARSARPGLPGATSACRNGRASARPHP